VPGHRDRRHGEHFFHVVSFLSDAEGDRSNYLEH
jgi:hypothetical protein